MRHWGADAAGLANFDRSLRAALVWLATPETEKKRAMSDAVTSTGNWHESLGLMYGTKLMKYSSDRGSTASAKVTGSTIYFGSARVPRGGTFTLTVDGKSYGEFSCNGTTTTNAGRAYSPFVVRISSLSNTEHLVDVTVTSNGATVFALWFSGNSLSQNMSRPNVWVGNTLRMNALGYTLREGWDNGSNVAVERFNAIIRNACRELAADGLAIAYVDANASYNLRTDVQADNIHPNKVGHAHIAQAFLTAMRRPSDARP
jgi:hypothetical protein